MLCAAISNYGSVAAAAAFLVAVILGQAMLVWPVISFANSMLKKVQPPQGTKCPKFYFVREVLQNPCRYVRLCFDRAAAKVYWEEAKAYAEFIEEWYPSVVESIINKHTAAYTEYGKLGGHSV
jgi:hypothetical protein